MLNIKGKMVKDMEEFSKEIQSTKHNISESQSHMLNTIRNKIQSVYENTQNFLDTDFFDQFSNQQTHIQASQEDNNQDHSDLIVLEIKSILADIGFDSVPELIEALQRSEDHIFNLYTATQEKNEELEKIDQENKYLEKEIEEQVPNLFNLLSYQ